MKMNSYKACCGCQPLVITGFVIVVADVCALHLEITQKQPVKLPGHQRKSPYPPAWVVQSHCADRKGVCETCMPEVMVIRGRWKHRSCLLSASRLSIHKFSAAKWWSSSTSKCEKLPATWAWCSWASVAKEWTTTCIGPGFSSSLHAASGTPYQARRLLCCDGAACALSGAVLPDEAACCRS